MQNEKIIRYRFTAYLKKSIQVCKSKYRKKTNYIRKSELPLDGYYKEVIDNINSPSKESEKFEIQVFFNDTMPERDKKILIMHIIDGFTLKEISEILNINYDTVRKSYYRNKKKIKEKFRGGG